MRVAVFSTKPYDEKSLLAANQDGLVQFTFHRTRLDQNSYTLSSNHDAICAFVNDQLSSKVIQGLKEHGIRLIALRCAGYNNVDLKAAQSSGIPVVRVPAYSPHAVAEHTVALILALNRKLIHASQRVRESNFSLDGLLGFDLHGRTVGLIGTGKIGMVVAKIMLGFGCRVLAYDKILSPEIERMGVQFATLSEVIRQSHIISLHVPLIPETLHLVNAQAIAQMRDGVMLVNTSRGGLIDTPAIIDGLKSGKIGYVGLDVYEEEAALFFEDKSREILQDDIFARLLTFSNVIVTGHQAFFTEEALHNIATTTVRNLVMFKEARHLENQILK